ncbi:MAG: hypothetical protein ACRDKL_04825 [Solirubrobacteraceae bacterium]
MSRARSLLHFLWDFVIGDDWRIALAVAGGIALTAILGDNDVHAWWLLPAVVAVLLSLSVWQAARSGR